MDRHDGEVDRGVQVNSMSLHSNISPSSAERWINCPGSVALNAAAPKQKSSIHSATGTCGHGLGEKMLKGELTKAQLLDMEGETIKVEGFDILVDEKLIDGVIAYYDTVMEFKAKADKESGGNVFLGVEQKLVASSIDEHVYGTADVVLCGKKYLDIMDYKNGSQPVEVDENPQLTIYGIAGLDHFRANERTHVRLTVIQPNARHADGPVRTWEAPIAYLTAKAVEYKKAVAATREANPAFHAGKWCKWCVGNNGSCPEKFRAVQEMAKTDFTALNKMPAVGSLPSVQLMTVQQRAQAYEWKEAITSWFKALEEGLFEELEAGREVPGWKMVDGDKGNRKWISEESVVAEFGGLYDIFEKKLLSPAKLEKIVGKGKATHLTERPDGKKIMVRSSDPRPPAKTSAADDFGRLGVADDNNPLAGLM